MVLITTGSQGEPLSALSRMASCSHRQVRVGPGDFIIISANPIPGNEKSVTKIVNGLLLLGAEVIYESMYDVHVSGHACQEEQKLMLTLTRPKYFLPVHGEYKQLKKHAITAASLGIPTSNILIAENGSNIILSQDEIKLGEPVTAGAVMVDGLGVGDVGNVVLRDRKHLSEDGLVIIVATVDSKTGKVLAGPDLVSRGFVYVRENESLMDGAQSIVEDGAGPLRGGTRPRLEQRQDPCARGAEQLYLPPHQAQPDDPPHPDGGLIRPPDAAADQEAENLMKQKPRWTLEMLTAALAVLCALAGAWCCWYSARPSGRCWLCWWCCGALACAACSAAGCAAGWPAGCAGGSFENSKTQFSLESAEPARRPPVGGDGAVVQRRVPPAA